MTPDEVGVPSVVMTHVSPTSTQFRISPYFAVSSDPVALVADDHVPQPTRLAVDAGLPVIAATALKWSTPTIFCSTNACASSEYARALGPLPRQSSQRPICCAMKQ